MQQYYDKGDIQLYSGDCIEILEKATPESVDMIFADPPYMLSNGGISCQAGKVVLQGFLKAVSSSDEEDKHEHSPKHSESGQERPRLVSCYGVDDFPVCIYVESHISLIC